MKHTATLKTQSKNPLGVCKALEADNISLEGLKIESSARDGMIESRVESESINTLLSTVNDIIRCQAMAESLI
jgi:hypothetical protein